jgi:hypothetical protein
MSEQAPAPEGGGATDADAGAKKLTFRQKAARRLEEAKRGASQLLEEAEESANQAATAAKASYEQYQLAGKFVSEDKYAAAWRGMCMAELEEPAAAQGRLHDYAADGALEAENPMAERAKKVTMQSGVDAGTRLAEQDELVATMSTAAKTLAEQQQQALEKIQAAAVQLMPAADQEQGAVAADVEKILEACSSVDLAVWAEKVTESIGLTESGKSAAFAGLMDGELKAEGDAKAAAQSQMQEVVTTSLEAADLDAAQTEVTAKERALVGSQAKHTALLVTMRTQAYTTSLDQLAAFVDAQSSFFAAGLAAMEALKPQVEALQARSAQATATAALMQGKLDELVATVEDDSQEVPDLHPAPPARTLRAGTSVLGKSLGPPQFQGYLHRDGIRRWCVLINGKLYEYADTWDEAPIGVTSMFLCNAKAAAESRFGIELLSMNPEMKAGTPPVPIVYQATSEELQQQWLKTITACTEFMITHPPSGDDAAVEEDPQVTAVRSVAGNEMCADCSREMPEWVSTSLGVTVCSECSGAHRGLGVHISKVQSLALDRLDDVTMELLQGIGNEYANSLWESAGIPDGVKPQPSASRAELATFVTAKYKDRAYVDKTISEAATDSALLEVLKAGVLRDVDKCLVGGCNVNASDPKMGKSALMTAVESGNLSCVELIVNNGADLLATDESGQTVLHQVVHAKNEPALRLLVKRGAWVSLDTEDSNGATPRKLAEGEDSEAFVAAMQDASDAVEAKKAQEARMAAGKVYYDATRQLAEGKITDAIAALESGLVSLAAIVVSFHSLCSSLTIRRCDALFVDVALRCVGVALRCRGVAGVAWPWRGGAWRRNLTRSTVRWKQSSSKRVRCRPP